MDDEDDPRHNDHAMRLAVWPAGCLMTFRPALPCLALDWISAAS
jgi:hypothetical protein